MTGQRGQRLRRLIGFVPYSGPLTTLASIAAALVAMAIYVPTLMPGVGFWDTAEAQTVPYTLSIFHPTGYPTYTLLGWAWSQLPIGEVAYRMNLFSSVCVALAAALTVHVTGHLVGGRSDALRAGAGAVAGASFAFASEPWRNAVRADVHALHVLFAALIIWMLLCWAAAERAGSPRRGRWLGAAALTFGIGLGNHGLMTLLVIPIAVWILFVDVRIWQRWRLVASCVLLLAAGLLVYLYIPIRAAIDPPPPLFYAHPDNWERFRYLVLAEQFGGQFSNFSDPFGNFGAKWSELTDALEPQFPLVGWLLVGVGLVILAWRYAAAAIFLGLIAVIHVIYAVNFEQGDVDRYYMTAVLVAAPMLGVAIAAQAGVYARAALALGSRLGGWRVRRRLALGVGAAVVLLAAGLPAYGVASLYEERDMSDDRAASRWVDGVYAAVPENGVVISWWSFSTPLWYHRWVLGERPDLMIIDDRNILDDGYGDIYGAVDAFLGERPVYVVPNDYTAQLIRSRYRTVPVPTTPGYGHMLLIEGRL